MAKLYCTSILMAIIFVLASVGILVQIVEGEDICREGLGQCGTDCNERCVARHPGGEGTCDRSIPGAALCLCLYKCGGSPPAPAPPKRDCNNGLGVCSESCPNSCCNAKCAAKLLNGVGSCVDALGSPLKLCQCQYTCS